MCAITRISITSRSRLFLNTPAPPHRRWAQIESFRQCDGRVLKFRTFRGRRTQNNLTDELEALRWYLVSNVAFLVLVVAIVFGAATMVPATTGKP